MRTTIDLPDQLVRAARARAAERDETLKDLLTRALTRELGSPPTKRRGKLPLIESKRRGTVHINSAELDLVRDEDDID